MESKTRYGGVVTLEQEIRRRVFKDPVSAWTHFVGFWFAVVGASVLVALAWGNGPKVVAMGIYGGTLAALFLASSLYHFFDIGERGNRWLRRLDHAAIFLLIAGSYVPPLTHFLDGAWRVSMLSIVGGLALVGVVFKFIWVECPDKLSTAIYLGLGYVVLVPGYKILPQLTGAALTWLIAGGLAYTAGAVVYVKEWPDPWPERFGHHEIWHLFVLAGAGAHFLFMVTMLDDPIPL